MFSFLTEIHLCQEALLRGGFQFQKHCSFMLLLCQAPVVAKGDGTEEVPAEISDEEHEGDATGGNGGEEGGNGAGGEGRDAPRGDGAGFVGDAAEGDAPEGNGGGGDDGAGDGNGDGDDPREDEDRG